MTNRNAGGHFRGDAPEGRTRISFADAHRPWLSRCAFWIVGLTGSFTPSLAPIILSAIAKKFAIPPQQAGWVASVELAGTALGALLTTLSLGKISGRTALTAVGLIAFAVQIASSLTNQFPDLLALRAVAGATSGCFLGYSFAAIGATRSPTRNFACFTAIVYIGSALGIYILPALGSRFGLLAIYGVAAALVAATILLSPAFPRQTTHVSPTLVIRGGGVGGASIFAALAMFSLFFAMGGVWPFLAQIGQLMNGSSQQTASVLATGSVFSCLAAFAAIAIGDRFGRLLPLAGGSLGVALASLAMLIGGSPIAFNLGAVCFCFSLTFATPFLLAIPPLIDSSGRLMTFSIAIQDVALAAGPAAAALMIARHGLAGGLWTGVVGGVLTPVFVVVALRKHRASQASVN